MSADEQDMDCLETYQAKIRDYEEKLLLSATYGQQLVEENKRLKEQCQQEQKEEQAQVTALKQEIHTLKQQLQCSDESQEFYQGLEQDNQTLRDEAAQLSHQLHLAKQSARDSATQAKDLQCELEKVKEAREAVQEMARVKQMEVTKLMEQVEDLTSVRESYTQQFEEYDERMRLFEEMQARTEEWETEKQVLVETQAQLQQQLQALEEEREQLAFDLEAKTEALSESEGTVQAQKEIIKQQQDELISLKSTPAHLRTGTDLFSDVEAKRLQLVEEVLKLKRLVKKQAKTLDVSKARIAKLNSTISVLSNKQMGSKADEHEIRKLEEQLSQTVSDLKQALSELDTLDQRYRSAKQEACELSKGVDFGKSQVYIEHLEHQVSGLREQEDQLKREARNAKMLAASESSRLREAQQMLHTIEIKYEKSKSKCDQLALLLEEKTMIVDIYEKAEKEASSHVYVCSKCALEVQTQAMEEEQHSDHDKEQVEMEASDINISHSSGKQPHASPAVSANTSLCEAKHPLQPLQPVSESMSSTPTSKVTATKVSPVKLSTGKRSQGHRETTTSAGPVTKVGKVSSVKVGAAPEGECATQ
eukprot:m.27043 g.27043  ORF g.27043 m.27043 type:complete len:590 (+) comp8894_c0_seq2:2236-4005(+)